MRISQLGGLACVLSVTLTGNAQPAAPRGAGGDAGSARAGQRGEGGQRAQPGRNGRMARDAQVLQTPSAGVATELSAPELELLSQLHSHAQRIVDASTWAREHSQNVEVKELAQVLVRDYTQGDRVLAQYVQRRGGELKAATAYTPEQQRALQAQQLSLANLRKLHGPELDRAFLQAIQQQHEQARQTLTEAREASGDPQLEELLDWFEDKHDKHLATTQRLWDELAARRPDLESGRGDAPLPGIRPGELRTPAPPVPGNP